jgi:hypothetical protein
MARISEWRLGARTHLALFDAALRSLAAEHPIATMLLTLLISKILVTPSLKAAAYIKLLRLNFPTSESAMFLALPAVIDLLGSSSSENDKDISAFSHEKRKGRDRLTFRLPAGPPQTSYTYEIILSTQAMVGGAIASLFGSHALLVIAAAAA